MKLNEFKIGDRVTDHKMADDPLDQRSPYYEIKFIGKEYVILLGSYGEELVALGEAANFKVYVPPMTNSELRDRVEYLTMLGDDLVAGIRNAAWDNELTGPTYHMRSAADRWEEARRV